MILRARHKEALNIYKNISIYGLELSQGMQGWCSGEGAHLPPSSDSWVEFVVDSRPCSEGFSPGSPVFFPPQKSTLINSNSIRKRGPKCHPHYIRLFILFIFSSVECQSRCRILVATFTFSTFKHFWHVCGGLEDINLVSSLLSTVSGEKMFSKDNEDVVYVCEPQLERQR